MGVIAPLVGLGSSIVGGIMGAAGQRQQAGAVAASNYYNAKVAHLNAETAAKNADWARFAGEKSAETYGLQAAAAKGQVRAGLAASGLDVNSGSAADVQKSQKYLSDFDQSNIRLNAARTAYNYTVQMVDFLNQEKLLNAAGENAASAGSVGAAASLLGSATSVASKWLEVSKYFGNTSVGGLGRETY